MERTDQGLELTKQEARDLVRISHVASSLRNWGGAGDVLREPTAEERADVQDLYRQLVPLEDTEMSNSSNADRRIIGPEYLPALKRITELALDNSQSVVYQLCVASVCDGFQPARRANAHRLLAMTADISQAVGYQEQS